MRELRTCKAEAKQSGKNHEGFRKLLWKIKNKSSDKASFNNNVLLTVFFEAFFAGQRKWERNPNSIEQRRGG